MRDFDLTPVWRSTIGFDRLFDLIDDSFRLQGEDNYPPYNIARVGEDHYRISLALAGFKPEEITVTAEQNMLTVEKAARRRTVITSTCSRASRDVRSGANLTSPTTSR